MAIYTQYQNAPKFTKLLFDLEAYLTVDPLEFYETYFNLNTCDTAGLDNWGRVLNRPRTINVIDFSTGSIFGFDTGTIPDPITTGYPQNFDHGNFVGKTLAPITLDDATYRTLLQFTWFRYTINQAVNPSTFAVNFWIQNTTNDPTKTCKITEIDGFLDFYYDFNYKLSPIELSLFKGEKILPRPAGRKYLIREIL